ncbi:MAG: protein translocase subunit SecD [Gammaproteobacteria bacterium]|jgi:preprotein translocase subunit SecD|nr:protein translocase subunit SecD [Gammaproteobacteria bacterium]NCF80742.1 protein translocase subunit SecD [Pseudomonadota bacterium]
MNQYPVWKYLLIVAVLVIGIFFALPNLYGNNPAVQVKADRDAPIDEILEGRIVGGLQSLGVEALRVERNDRNLLLRFADENTQLKAQDYIAGELGRQYVVALNLAPATPPWLEGLGALPMYLGLDLRGGVHFLMEVDMDGAIRLAEQRYAADLRQMLREEKIRYAGIARRDNGGVLLGFRDEDTRQRAYDLIRRELSELDVSERDDGRQPEILVKLNERAVADVKRFALQQNITTLRNRVNELGVAEPVIQQQGSDRIVVQLPGVQDTAKAKEILGATATLEFRMADTEHSVQEALAGRVPATARLYRESDGSPILLKRSVMLSGEYITDASSGLDQQSGTPAVFITLDGKGASLFSKRTRDKIGRPMATVFIENKSETRLVDGLEVKKTITEETVINVATIRDQLGKRFQITGLDSTEEARDLALLLRAGALAAPVEIIEERTVGPSLGAENIEQGFRSVIIGFILVLVFMAVYYRVFGLVANLALTFNLVMIVAVLSMLQATLTLPGIAGIVLTTGMAVDANVLIFERIREEIRNGNTPQASIEAGYKKAFSTIADANITTLIAAVVLFGFGTGPIKGFAITLSIGIATSMFTAIMGTRAVINLFYGGRRVPKLQI